MGLDASETTDTKPKPKHGFTPNDPNLLGTVVVIDYHTHANLHYTYWY